MAVWTCTKCTTAYSVDAPECPQCGADKPAEKAKPKPKPKPKR